MRHLDCSASFAFIYLSVVCCRCCCDLSALLFSAGQKDQRRSCNSAEAHQHNCQDALDTPPHGQPGQRCPGCAITNSQRKSPVELVSTTGAILSGSRQTNSRSEAITQLPKSAAMRYEHGFNAYCTDSASHPRCRHTLAPCRDWPRCSSMFFDYLSTHASLTRRRIIPAQTHLRQAHLPPSAPLLLFTMPRAQNATIPRSQP